MYDQQPCSVLKVRVGAGTQAEFLKFYISPDGSSRLVGIGKKNRPDLRDPWLVVEVTQLWETAEGTLRIRTKTITFFSSKNPF